MIKIIRKLIQVIALFIWLPVFSSSIEVSGNVAGIWNVDTVKVIGHLNIRESDMLEIHPGVMVLFMGDFVFHVKGVLKAIGNAQSRIRFTVADTTGFSNDTIPGGGWMGIRYHNISPSVDSSVFRYCTFEFGKAVRQDSLLNLGGVMSIRNFHKIEISHCQFFQNKARDKGGAIYLNNASIKLYFNDFVGNSAGKGISLWGYGGAICADHSSPLIYRNNFTLNSASGIGGGVVLRFSDAPVYFNVFRYNHAGIGGALSLLHIPVCQHVISNNLIYQNLSIFFGGGVSNNNASPTWVNNTIVFNQSLSFGGGFYCKDSINPKVYNTILWGNQAALGNQVYLWDTYAQASFYHCNVQGGLEGFAGAGSGGAFTGQYINNIDEDPLFENVGLHEFWLTALSPCIDSGIPDTTGLMIPTTDLAGNPRISGSSIDIGAYEFQFPVNVSTLARSPFILISPPYPNPTAGEINFVIETIAPQQVELIIHDLMGHAYRQLVFYLSAGVNLKTYFPELPPGTYIYRLFSPEWFYSGKIVVRN